MALMSLMFVMSMMSVMTLGERHGHASQHVMVPWQESLFLAPVCIEWSATSNAKRKLVWLACKQVGWGREQQLVNMDIMDIDLSTQTATCEHGHQPINMDIMDTNTNLSTWTYGHQPINMDTNLGTCKAPDKILEIACRPGRLVKDTDNVWRAPSHHPTGGRVIMLVTMGSVMYVLGFYVVLAVL